MKFGLIGKNIEYSKSKEIFESQGFEYKIYDVPNVELGLQAAIDDKLDGFNITTPFKHDIIQYMDCLMKNAEKTQSVNCVKILNDMFIGENFDYQAFINSLTHYIDNHDAWEFDFPHNTAILGNGGVISSIKSALEDWVKGAISIHNVTVFARNPKEGQQPLSDFNAKDFDLIVNTIPFKSGIDINFNCKGKFIYYDLNYTDDTLIKKAERNNNCSWAIDGFDMLERQADMALNWCKENFTSET